MPADLSRSLRSALMVLSCTAALLSGAPAHAALTDGQPVAYFEGPGFSGPGFVLTGGPDQQASAQMRATTGLPSGDTQFALAATDAFGSVWSFLIDLSATSLSLSELADTPGISTSYMGFGPGFVFDLSWDPTVTLPVFDQITYTNADPAALPGHVDTLLLSQGAPNTLRLQFTQLLAGDLYTIAPTPPAAPVPEASTAMLLLAGLLTMSLCMRKRRLAAACTQLPRAGSAR